MKIPYDKIINGIHSVVCIMISSSRNSTNIAFIDGAKALLHNQQFARIPSAVKHKVALCLTVKFFPKKNIVKKL